jgi:glycosyltransferase involved in cell wall biosynthesis
VKLCAVSFKECWVGPDGRWASDGGFPLQMSALATLFDEMTLVTVVGPARSGGIALPAGLTVVPVPKPAGTGWRRKLDVAWSSPGLVRTLREAYRDADVIHTPLPGDLPLVGFVVALLAGKRTIARYGGSWKPTAQTTLMNRVTRQLMRMAAGGRNVMLATGDPADIGEPRVRAIFSTALSERELATIDPRIDRGLSTPPCAVYAGRLSPEKGVHVLVDALAILRARDVVVPHVVLAGEGPERAALEAAARSRGVADALTFAGQLDRPALSAVLADADFCVQPSLSEGFSKAWLDALAHGLPVLASDVGAAGAVVGRAGERGWIVPPGDVEALSLGLERVMVEERDWPSLRAACRAYVEGRTLEAWAREIGRLCAGQMGLTLERGKLRP